MLLEFPDEALLRAAPAAPADRAKGEEAVLRSIPAKRATNSGISGFSLCNLRQLLHISHINSSSTDK